MTEKQARSAMETAALVRYFPLKGREEHDGKVYTVRHVGPTNSTPGAEAQAWLNGKAGCVALWAIRLAERT